MKRGYLTYVDEQNVHSTWKVFYLKRFFLGHTELCDVEVHLLISFPIILSTPFKSLGVEYTAVYSTPNVNPNVNQQFQQKLLKKEYCSFCSYKLFFVYRDHQSNRGGSSHRRLKDRIYNMLVVTMWGVFGRASCPVRKIHLSVGDCS